MSTSKKSAKVETKTNQGRYSFWNTKRSDQHTPSSTNQEAHHEGHSIKTPKGISSESSYNCFDEVKLKHPVAERAETEIMAAS